MEEVYCLLLQDHYTIPKHQEHLKRLCIDSSHVKNVYGKDILRRSPTDRGRKGTKISTITDEAGITLAFRLDKSNESDYNLLEPTMENMLINPKYYQDKIKMYGDKGYDSKRLRTYLRHKGYMPVIGKRKAKGSSEENNQNKGRNYRYVIEASYSWMDKFRRTIMRFDQYASSYQFYILLAWSHLVSLR